MKHDENIVILGAGLSGLSAAWHLQKRGKNCQVFEKESESGGLCRSKNVNGFTFDYDGHLLHFKNDYTLKLVKNLLGDDLIGHSRKAAIYSFNRLTDYPFQFNLYGLPERVIKECITAFVEKSEDNQLRKKKNLNFLDWMNHKLGKGITRHFMIPYNKKFWTVPPEELTWEWTDGFVPVPTMRELIKGSVAPGADNIGYNHHFWYPKKGGIKKLPQAFIRKIKNLHTGHEAIKIDSRNKKVYFQNGASCGYSKLINTLPLPELSRLIPGLPSAIERNLKQLRHTSILNINLGFDEKDFLNKHWVYFPEKSFSFFRVGFYHSFSRSSAPEGKSSIYTEISYSKDKPINKNNIYKKTIGDLIKSKILNRKHRLIASDINDIKYGYVLFDRNHQKCTQAITAGLKAKDIYCAGRYGSWRYFSMEGAILDGKRAAEEAGKC